MELSKTILYSLVILALLVGAVDVAAGEEASTAGTDATEAVGSGWTDDAEIAQCSSDHCNTLVGDTCEALQEYKVCIEQVMKDCDDEGKREEMERFGNEKINLFNDDLKCQPVPVINSAPTEPTRQPEISVTGPTASTEITSNEPVVKETTAETASELLTTEGITIKSTKTSTSGEQQVTKKIPSESVAKAEKEVPMASSTIPTAEPTLPKCEEPIAKAAEIQKCNDLIKQDSFCIQLQKAVDCVEVRANCSEKNFDQQVEIYLGSLENYARDYKCIITYNGKRLEHRKKP